MTEPAGVTTPPGFEFHPLHVAPGVDQLAAALAAVQAELPTVRKGQEADAGQYSYTYADLAEVSAAIMPLLGKNGLAFTAFPTINAKDKFVLRYELLHKSGQTKSGEYPLGGGNAQAVGSAITYARRYTLCAVTGVAPADDDGAAASMAVQEVRQAEQTAQQDRERQAALDAVRGAWFNQYGEWNPTSAADMFIAWSKGTAVGDASAKQLKSFAGYLHTLPANDAGSTPDPEQAPAEGEVREVKNDPPLSGRQQGMMFALFEDLGWKNDRGRQLQYLSGTLGRTIKSRSEVRASDADTVLKALEADVAKLNTTGEIPQTGAEAARPAQSAAAETSVPAASAPPRAGR